MTCSRVPTCDPLAPEVIIYEFSRIRIFIILKHIILYGIIMGAVIVT